MANDSDTIEELTNGVSSRRTQLLMDMSAEIGVPAIDGAADADVAGPSWNNGGPRGYTPKRATGVPVRTVVATLREIASK